MRDDKKLPADLLRRVSRYIQENYEASCEARHFTKERPPGVTGKALKSLIKAVLHIKDKTFTEKLLSLIDERGAKPSKVYLRAGMTKQHFSKIKTNPDYQPSKETALAFAIVLRLSLDETKDLIGRAGFTLSHSNRRDMAVECLIKEKVYDIDTVNSVLYELDMPPLTNRRNT